MKTIIRISILCAAILTVSCADFLQEDPRGRQEVEKFYDNDNAALQGLYGVYQQAFVAGVLRQNFPIRTDAASDMFASKPNAAANGAHFVFYSLSPDATVMIEGWNAGYKAIYAANSFIYAMEHNAPKVSAEAKTQYIREAKFLRALVYYHLIMRHGDLPFITEPADPANPDRPRTPRAQMWQTLITDLEDALNLPAKGSTPKGRADKGCAATLLAKIHLANVADPPVGTDHFTKAKAVLDVDEYWTPYGLWESITDVWKISNQFGKESIFELDCAAGQTPTQNSAWIGLLSYSAGKVKGGNGTYPVNHYQVRRAGFGNWENPEDAVSWYDADLSERTLHFYSATPIEGDNFQTTYKYTTGGTPKEFKVTTNYSDLSHLMKFTDFTPSDNFNFNNSGMNLTILRYADVVLMKAEVECEVGDMDKALTLLNSIRKRPNDAKGDSLYTFVEEPGKKLLQHRDGPQAALREAIREERALELIGEGWRLGDLKRWGSDYALEKLKESRECRIPGSKAHPYPNQQVVNNITKERLYWPIPEGEMRGNDLIEQNPGYGL